MFIVLKNNTYIHWWGKEIVLIFEEGYYKLNKLETYFVKKILCDNCKEHILTNIQKELMVTESEAESFVLRFMSNYSQIFEYQEENKARINISGEENKFYPFELHISLTSFCNHRCMHCYKNAGINGENINYNAIVNFLRFMNEKVPFLTLSGGDAMIYPQIKELIKEFGTSYQICILSSGYEIKEDMVEVLKCASRGVYVSIYSAYSNIHDKFVGVKNSYSNIMKNIKKLCEAGVSVGVTTILTETNEDDIVNLVQILSEKKVKQISIGTVSNLGRAKENGLSSTNKEILFNKIEEIQKRFSNKVTIQKNGEKKCEKVLSPFKCLAGSLLWCVYENGKIYPCAMCETDKLLMGTVEEYSECLADIELYYKKISELPMMKKLDNSEYTCPLGEDGYEANNNIF